MAYNIKQINKLSEEVINAKTFEIEIKPDEKIHYIQLDIEGIVKFGYICEDNGIGLPIFLKIDGEYKRFEIGKTGMYEASNILIDGIRIPCGEEKDFTFTFDYVTYNAD